MVREPVLDVRPQHGEQPVDDFLRSRRPVDPQRRRRRAHDPVRGDHVVQVGDVIAVEVRDEHRAQHRRQQPGGGEPQQHPRPQSTSTDAPAVVTSVDGPARFGSGIGLPVPSSVIFMVRAPPTSREWRPRPRPVRAPPGRRPGHLRRRFAVRTGLARTAARSCVPPGAEPSTVRSELVRLDCPRRRGRDVDPGDGLLVDLAAADGPVEEVQERAGQRTGVHRGSRTPPRRRRRSRLGARRPRPATARRRRPG